ncbi:MAG TPA: chloride channel protein [Thermodesulfobacteriota bacterium]|nr:chloride channel protein [Thermodesulfobacteriota bacterium]
MKIIVRKFFLSFSPVRMKWIWRWIFLGILIGVVSGLGAILFNFLIQRGTQFFMKDLVAILLPKKLEESFFWGIPVYRWMILCIPALGGLLSGLIVFRFAPEAEGHGTDAMIDSFHRKRGIIRKRVPIIKTIASAITIGSGGSAGKEGPIAQIGSGFASFLSSLLKTGERDRRLMLLAGAAGGIGAIFKAPLGAALFATEVLYQEPEFEFEGIIPSILSSIVAYSVFTLFYGWETIFHIPKLAPIISPSELLVYGVFGVICAVVGFFYIHIFYDMRDRFFKKLNIRRSFKPALGGLLLGGLALFFPQVLGGGYEWIQSAIDGNLTIGLMLFLAIAKIFSTSFTISSGGSGGVFAPSLFIGAMLGGFYGTSCSKLFPDLLINPSAFVLVGMGGFFAGVAKVPVASLIMVAEMTGGYALIVPLMIVSTISYLLLGKTSLYEKQVSERKDSPAHVGDFVIDILEHIRVKDALPLGREIETIPEGMRFEKIIQLVVQSKQANFPVVDKNGNLRGILSLTDIRRVMFEKELHNLVVAKDIATQEVLTVTPEDNLNTALKKMTMAEIRELPVVSREYPQKVLSMLSRKDLIKTYHDEIERHKEERASNSIYKEK